MLWFYLLVYDILLLLENYYLSGGIFVPALSREKSIDFLKNKAKEDGGVFVCPPELFLKIYHLENRRNKRTDNRLFILKYKLTDKDKTKKQLAEKLFLKILNNNLRCCDVITKDVNGNYLQLLTAPSSLEAQIVIDRIKDKFEQENSDKEISLKCSYKEI